MIISRSKIRYHTESLRRTACTGWVFSLVPPKKVLSIRLHSKSHQKSSKCQNLLTSWHLELFGGTSQKTHPVEPGSDGQLPSLPFELGGDLSLLPAGPQVPDEGGRQQWCSSLCPCWFILMVVMKKVAAVRSDNHVGISSFVFSNTGRGLYMSTCNELQEIRLDRGNQGNHLRLTLFCQLSMVHVWYWDSALHHHLVWRQRMVVAALVAGCLSGLCVDLGTGKFYFETCYHDIITTLKTL